MHENLHTIVATTLTIAAKKNAKTNKKMWHLIAHSLFCQLAAATEIC